MVLKCKFFFLFFIVFLIFPLTVQTKRFPVVWVPDRIEERITEEETKEIEVAFVSTVDLSNVDLRIVPELQPFIRIEPSHFNSIDAHTLNEVTISISIPENTEPNRYEGTIHIKEGRRTLPQTLKIEINVDPSDNLIGPEGGTVVSDDGRLTLIFPEGALSGEERITIETLDPSGIQLLADGKPPSFAYELGPGGLQFNEPVFALLNLDSFFAQPGIDLEDNIAFLVNASGDLVDFLENHELSINGNTGSVTVSGKLSHFSTLVGFIAGQIRVAFSGLPEILPAGEEFNVKVTVSDTEDSEIRADRVVYFDFSRLPILVLDGEARGDEDGDDEGIDMGILDPNEVEMFEKEVPYKCNKAGLGSFKGRVVFQSMVVPLGLPEAILPKFFSTLYRITGNKRIICRSEDAQDGTVTADLPDEGGSATLSVEPFVNTHFIGESFEVTLTEDLPVPVKEMGTFITDIFPGIVSEPELTDTSGTQDVSLEKETFDPDVDFKLDIDNAVQGINSQTLRYTCNKKGDTALNFHFIILSDIDPLGSSVTFVDLFAIVRCKSPEPEKCDDTDNDGDGEVDEDFPDKNKPCSVGEGACENTGIFECTPDGTGTECNVSPLPPGIEGPAGDPTCSDEIDNDCDSTTDGADSDCHSRPVYRLEFRRVSVMVQTTTVTA
jgi:hypothetical protein